MISFIALINREHTFVAQGLSVFTSQMQVIFILSLTMTNSSPKLKQPQKPKKTSEHLRKRRLALQIYAER
jgi:hypothetical protein